MMRRAGLMKGSWSVCEGCLVPRMKCDASGIWDRSRGSGAPEGTAYEVKPLTRIHRVPEALIGPDSPEGIAVSHRVAVMHYLLDMG